ncbi:MAG: hypothetical protein ACOZNI_36750 [Myxococcota bacterium]
MLTLVLVACTPENDLQRADVTETFVQEGTDQVDVLWVVDDSISMSEEQGLVAQGFDRFVSALAEEGGELDLHIGVVTTDMDRANETRGDLVGEPKWLSGTEPDFQDQFRARVSVGTGGSDMEQGLAAAWSAVSSALLGGTNEGFMREDANLAVIFVSDENDCSHGGEFPDDGEASLCYDRQADLVPVQDFVLKLAQAPEGEGRTVASAIVGPEADVGCETATPGHRYTTVADKLNGVAGDICETDYDALLDGVARQIVAPMHAFPLEHRAMEETLEVTVDGALVPMDPESGWWYDADYQTVRFDGAVVPDYGAVIEIYYVISA